ncbi:MAG: hypothetical protein Q3959_00370 [Limosilactobacillus sp.]|uniref:hypothetical protein n=1 Tax=Limosilactobacillus sp. TaxID=2773925 RepID=UPI0027006FB2|nr:hypothetical protein [Limosilactobacillus sp.]
MKWGRKYLNVLMILLLAVGLAACASNSSTNMKKEAASSDSKVEKTTARDKAPKDKAKASKSTQAPQQPNTQPSAAVQAPSTNQAATPTEDHITVDLAHIAVWTDSQGRIHHVNWDGTDRITTRGGNSVEYGYWEGYLPSNAKLYAYKDYSFNVTDSNKWVLMFDQATGQ